jgi:uncharacterized membrane protein
MAVVGACSVLLGCVRVACLWVACTSLKDAVRFTQGRMHACVHLKRMCVCVCVCVCL